jgi:asparagine synthase (glutamine-hydrolysing)
MIIPRPDTALEQTSGFCGALTEHSGSLLLDGTLPTREPSLRTLEQQQQWRNELVSFTVSPGRVAGEQSMSVNASETIVVVADADLHDLDTLGVVPSSNGHEPTSSDYILAAYERLGPRCVHHLSGSFSFAIWNGRDRSLMIARDRFGTKPLYYCADGLDTMSGVFGTSLKSVMQLVGPRPINRRALINMIAGIDVDTYETCFTGVYALPPGTFALLGESSEVVRYYDLTEAARGMEIPKSARDLQAEYRELFRTSVSNHLGQERKVATMLSGGIDSVSIAAQLREITDTHAHRIYGYSAQFDHAMQSDEREFIEAARCLVDEWTAIDTSGKSSLQLAGDLSEELYHPVVAPHIGINWSAGRRAHDHGAAILFDGFDGDTVISHGAQRLNDLAAQWKWIEFGLSARSLSLLNGGGEAWRYWKKAVSYHALGRHRHRSTQSIDEAGRRYATRVCGESDQMIEEMAEDYRSWMIASARLPKSEADAHRQRLQRRVYSATCELIGSVGKLSGVEVRFPFFSAPLIEYAINVPAKYKINWRGTRVYHRQALSDILPDAVYRRRDKSNLHQAFIWSMDRYEIDEMRSVYHDTTRPVWHLVNRDWVGEKLSRYSTGDKKDAMTLYRVGAVNRWMESCKSAIS